MLEIYHGYEKAKLNIEEKHINALGNVQGGALFTLAYFAVAAAINAHGNAVLASIRTCIS